MVQQYFKENKQMIIILALLLGFLLWSVISQQLATTRISYSDFLRQVEAGNVQEITVKGDKVEGSLKQEATSEGQSYQDFLTYIPSFGEESLMQDLQDQGVQVNTEPEANPFFWYIIISMLPLLLIAGLVFAQYKRMQGQGGGIFSIGQSQAKQ
ncbi:MAG: ATP-dependent metallopeptidase FtsH/Yme1/Tma family protein, partial [Desulfohalobiaceae bacterium]